MPKWQTNFERGKHKMKKLIALVLFATMLFAFVPTANALDTNAYVVTVQSGNNQFPWYGASKPEYVVLSGGSTGKDTIGLNEGIEVEVKDNPRSISGEDADSEWGKTSTITVNLKGSYKDAESYMYSNVTNYQLNPVWGKAVKIPYTAVLPNSALQPYEDRYNISSLDGVTNPDWVWQAAQPYGYINFVLTEEDSNKSYYVRHANNGTAVIIKVTWDNTDNDPVKGKGPYPTLKVVGYDNTTAQYGNYTAEFKNMSYNADDKKETIGRLTYNIAAYTKKDRSIIWDAATSTLDVSRDFYKTDLDWNLGWWGFYPNAEYDGASIEGYVKMLESLAGGEVTGATLDQVVWKVKAIKNSNGVTTGYQLLTGADAVLVKRSDANGDLNKWAQNAGFDNYFAMTSNGNVSAIFDILTVNGKFYVWYPKDNTMDVRLKAFDTKGVPYPAGTIIAIREVQANWAPNSTILQYAYDMPTWTGPQTVYLWDYYLGKSSKYVNIAFEPTYVIDQNNCFVFTMHGIMDFAISAGYYKDVTQVYNAYTDEDIVLLYQNQLKLMQLLFTNGQVQEEIRFDVYFKNINRTKSGITVIGDREISIELGKEVALPYVLDDALAMATELDTAWVSSEKKIVEVTDAKKGVIKAKAVGKAYLYATDAAGNFQLFVVNVIDPAAVVVPPVAAGKTYVITASSLNVRTGPGTSYKSLGTLKRGTEVVGFEVDGSVWVQVTNVKGVDIAYVSGKYLAEK